MKHKLIYLLGKRSRRIRRWYYINHDRKYLWGIQQFIVDTHRIPESKCNYIVGYDSSDLDEFLEKMEKR